MSNKTTDKKEKRGYPRVKKLYLISFSKVEGRQSSPISMGRTLDVSPTGVRVETYQNIKINTRMEIQIGLGEFDFSVQGKVVHTQEVNRKVYIIGIAFDEIEPELGDKNMGIGQWDHIDS
jgi:hypothetical protein